MKVTSKIPTTVNKQNPATKVSTVKKDAQNTALSNSSRKVLSEKTRIRVTGAGNPMFGKTVIACFWIWPYYVSFCVV